MDGADHFGGTVRYLHRRVSIRHCTCGFLGGEQAISSEKVLCKVLRPFYFKNRHYKVGDVLKVSERDMKDLERGGHGERYEGEKP